ncbi:MAG: T9SS type A sorting domain-containing protein [Endomicrobium sp.]|jgi:endoglucanase Acf2|nr:T9SS type A sorting domain-containing protein [Endomicrobium sp.]
MTLKNTKKIVIAFAAVLFFVSAGFSAPSPGGKGRLGSYPSPLPSPRVTQKVSFPYPTNRWFGSIFTKNANHDYSIRMSASPWIVNLNTGAGGSAAGKGYLLGYPEISFMPSPDKLHNNYEQRFVARISGKIQSSGNREISSSKGLLDGYSDWSATFICRDSLDSSQEITTTIGKGFIFTYNEYSVGLNPYIGAYSGNITVYDAQGNTISGNQSADKILVKGYDGGTANRVIYYAVYAPENTTFNISSGGIDIAFSSAERYLSIALITAGEDNTATKDNAVEIFNDYYKYAYNFITDTKVSYDFQDSKVKTTFDFITAPPKRTGGSFLSGTVFALFPHQWKNSSTALKPDKYNFRTLRGVLKVGTGSSFTTENKFFGILPNLTYEVPEASRNTMRGYINTDKNFSAQGSAADTYYSGKGLAKAANLIPIFHQFGDIASRNQMIERLKAQLELWYKNGSGSKYFAYDSNWGGIIGRPYAFGSEKYNDHHFHYGYFIYASAILALFDPQFADSSDYKGIVDLLVRDSYSHVRNDMDFPYLRNFDIYEGHSWADGPGGGDDRGINQESSSEAMNAWAGIYLWGLASKNQELMDLGAYGYTTEYEATKEYFLDTSGEIYGGTPYAHKGIGILWDNESIYSLHFEPQISQTIKGIQVLPLTPSMLYHGYDTSYARSFYDEMFANRGTGVVNGVNLTILWKDIWLRYKSLFDAAGALSDCIAGGFSAEEGSSLTYSYQFINFFNEYGTIDTSVVADNGSFCVMTKGGTKSYIAFNGSEDYKTVAFKSVSGGASAGSMKVPPMTTAVTKDFINFKYDSLRTLRADGNNHVLFMNKYDDLISVSTTQVPVIDETYYKILPFAFTVNSSSGVLGDITGYVQLANITVPAGFTADQIKIAVYNSERNLPEKTYPPQSISVSTPTVLIKSTFSRVGTYVLVIPTGVQPPGLHVINGSLTNAKDGSNVHVAMQLYDSLSKSTETAMFNGSYEMEIIDGVNYVLTPLSEEFQFDRKNYSFTAGNADITGINFIAYQKYMLSGVISLNSKALGNLKVTVYDNAGSTVTLTTASDGKYTAEAYYGKTYTITPESQEYDFSPPYVTLNNVEQSYLNINFYAQIAADRFVVYPNPYKPSKHGNVGITFSNLKSGAEIKIYNIVGELVFDDKTVSDGSYVWYAENNSGNQAASGTYIYYIKSGGKVQRGKVTVER